MEIRGGEFNVAEAWSAKFPKVFRFAGDGKEARVLLAGCGSSKIVVSEVREEWFAPVLRF